MIRHTFTCNSLLLRHFLLALLSTGLKPNKGADAFRREFAKLQRIDESQVFLLASARMGLYVALESAGLAEGDEVVVPGYTCVAVTNVLKYLGIKSVYVDIDEDTLNIDPERLRRVIGPNTRAVIVPHNFGIVDTHIKYIRSEYPGLLVIEDAAHSIPAVSEQENQVGIYGSAAIYSFEFSKPVTTGMGGILAVRDTDLAKKVALTMRRVNRYPLRLILPIYATLLLHLLTSYRFTIWMKSLLFAVMKRVGLLYSTSEQEIAGERPDYYPALLSNSLAWIGYFQLRNWEDLSHRKRRVAEQYSSILTGINKIRTYLGPNMVRYPIVFDEAVTEEQISNIKVRARNEIGLDLGVWFNDVVHPIGSMRYGYEAGTCGVGERISKRIVNLPIGIHAPLTQSDMVRFRKILLEELK